MKKKDYKLYAIGMKGWVEIRKAKVPPKARVTTAKVMGSERKILNYHDWIARRDEEGVELLYPYWNVPKLVTIKVVNFVGGRTLKVVSKRRFSQFVGMSPKVGEMMEIPEELASISVLDKVMQRDYD